MVPNAARGALVIGLLTGWISSARAESIAFSHASSIYVDANQGALKGPEGVACSAKAVVVADTGNQRLVTYSMKGGMVDGGTELKFAQLGSPVCVEIDSKGNVIALDGRAHRAVRVGPSGAYAGYVDPAGTTVTAFKLDASDKAYLLDGSTRRVIVVDALGKPARQIALPEKGIFTDVAVDAGGVVYVVEVLEAMVWSADGSATAFKPLSGSLKDRMNFPSHLTASKGKLFLVDQHGMGIVVLGLDGAYLGRQLGIGWNEGLVYYPSQLCLTETGEAFLADRANNRVQMFTIR
jgi:hypothetical protein